MEINIDFVNYRGFVMILGNLLNVSKLFVIIKCNICVTHEKMDSQRIKKLLIRRSVLTKKCKFLINI